MDYKNEELTAFSTAPMWIIMFLVLKDEPTWRCHQNPFIGALGIQEPVILQTRGASED